MSEQSNRVKPIRNSLILGVEVLDMLSSWFEEVDLAGEQHGEGPQPSGKSSFRQSLTQSSQRSLHRLVRCVTSAKTQVALLKQEAVLATVQQHSPEQLIIIISCHDRVRINISIKNTFFYCLHKGPDTNSSLQNLLHQLPVKPTDASPPPLPPIF